MTRISFDHYFLALAFVASLRSEDPNRRVGAVCANNQHRVCATGYNGFAPKMDATDILTGSDTLRRKIIFHAEQNALLLCQVGEVETLAVTTLCCADCARLAANYQVKRVLYSYIYSDSADTLLIFKTYGVKVLQLSPDEIVPYTTNMFNERPLA